MPTRMAFGLLTDETYFFDDARARQTPAQYICDIMRHGIGCNIVDVANQLSFTYPGIAPKLRIFVLLPIESTRVPDFICALEEKQKVWYEMMITPAGPQQYYNPAQRPSPYRLPMSSQHKVFSCF